MGDPRKRRKKYESPKKVWDSERIKADGTLISKYGLKNMRELWRLSLVIKKVRREVRKMFSMEDSVVKDRSKKIIDRLSRLGVVSPEVKVEELLSLTTEDILKRRLQTQVVTAGLATTMGQARQLIVHGYIAVDAKKVKRPGLLVRKGQSVSYTKPIDLNFAPKAPVEESKEEPAAEPEPQPKQEQAASPES